MLSLADLVRWLASKAFAALLLLLVLVVVKVLLSYLPGWWELFQDTAARQAQVSQFRKRLSDLDTELTEMRKQLSQKPPLSQPIKRISYWWWERDLKNKIAKLEKERAEVEMEFKKLTGTAIAIIDRIHAAVIGGWPAFATIVAVVLLGPFFWRCCAFFILAPLTAKAPPLQLTEPTTPGDAATALPQRSLTLEIPSGEIFYFHPSCLHQRRNVETGSTWARFPQAPLITSAARLIGLTRVRAESEAQPATVVLGSTDPDMYFTILELRNHPGFVLQPRRVVGLSHGIEVGTRWKILRWHALLIGQVRYILFRGTGRIVLEGTGGIVGDSGDSNPSKLEHAVVAGFDARICYAATRTEQALGYIFGRASLMDDQFSGPSLFLREISPSARPGNLIHQTLGALWSALRKFFGF